MKYMLLIHQGTTPLPGSPEWEALPDDEKGKVYADYQAINETPGMTPGVQMASPETATTVRVQDGRTLTTDGPFAVSQRPTVRIGVTEGALREGHPAGWVWSVVSVNLGVAGVGVAHPSWIARRGAPAAAICVPKVWRNSWNVIIRTSAACSACVKRLRTLEASRT